MLKKCPYCAEEIQAEAIKCKHCHTWLERAPEDRWNPTPVFGGYDHGGLGTQLRRSTSDRVISGVCGGLGRYLGIDPLLLRILYAVLTAFTFGLPGVIVYIILAIVIPSDEQKPSWTD